ncbi:hypothetical protein AAFC00_000362 [Neodothiora populina]|uniref:AN1-type domain-containing protein n=1 Tax=Neodothiora populina TaxID=2781224 RepID=A0ABR3PD68_9PEZI
MSTPNTNNSTPKTTESSYTEMSVGDVDAIGSHCQMAFCRQLDFLPFKCESCKGQFCLDHRSETAHSCSNAGAWARARAEKARAPSGSSTPSSKPNVLTHEQQCSDPACKTLINTPLVIGIHCQQCNRSYCLKHRLREDHACDKLVPIGARTQTQKEKGFAALEKLRAWGASKQKALTTKTATSKTPSLAVARVQATAQLKKTAKGDDKIAAEKRVYLHVEAEASTTTAKLPSGAFFYSAEWSVGRVLDAAAKSLQIQNVNNRVEGEEDKLRVFHVEGGRLLEFSEKLGKAVQTGNTIVLLRGVGPAVPDLLQ